MIKTFFLKQSAILSGVSREKSDFAEAYRTAKGSAEIQKEGNRN